MGDLLIRDISDDLKREIEQSARKNGRSLSDEGDRSVAARLCRCESRVDCESGMGSCCVRLASSDDGVRDDEIAKVMDEIEASESATSCAAGLHVVTRR